jgi:hypothetical protein
LIRSRIDLHNLKNSFHGPSYLKNLDLPKLKDLWWSINPPVKTTKRGYYKQLYAKNWKNLEYKDQISRHIQPTKTESMNRKSEPTKNE